MSEANLNGGVPSIDPDGDDANQLMDIPEDLPLLPVRDVVVFPYMILPLFVGRDKSVEAVEQALQGNRMIFLATQKELSIEDPEEDDLYEMGTVALIMRMLKLPDGRVKILVQGLSRARRLKMTTMAPCLRAEVDNLEETPVSGDDFEAEAHMRAVREKLEQVINLGKAISTDIMMVLESVEDNGRLADIVAANLNLKVADAIEILTEVESKPRLELVHTLLDRELQVLTVQEKIKSAAKDEMTKSQREYFLRQQMKAIQEELGLTDEHGEEIEELRERIEKTKMSKDTREVALKELKRLRDMSPSSAEAGVIRTYIEWLVDVPWKKTTRDRLDLIQAKEVLDEDHYYLEKVKERILEHLAVKKLKPSTKGPILCFVGPPGVGKTSLGKSIARAMGRKFARISLGGVRDEAEIRGHRRTYVGAMPGRIIQGLKRVGVANPVFMLDEIDKLGQDFRGDPSSALLEVLDPAQNDSFEDHYLNVAYDLSKVMFICTANLADPIPHALLDRMEMIRLAGYTREEKLKIGARYIVPRQMAEQGINEDYIRFTEEALGTVVDQYTREAGLRNFEREVANICRKVARKIAEGKVKTYNIGKRNVSTFLGPPRFLRETESAVDQVGVANGLAWTQAGGEILHIEVGTMKGAGKLTLTGQLGDVMKESAVAALTWVRANVEEFGGDDKYFEKKDIHIHVPAGAIPKDGPSAGITIATALMSMCTGRMVDHSVAMTGEITLRGRVLPIGGVKEKCLAAMRAGVKTVIMPERNEKDAKDLPVKARKALELHFATDMEDVLKIVLKPKAKTKAPRRAPAKKVARGSAAKQPARQSAKGA
jgi:ATP-dependent Lon protease